MDTKWKVLAVLAFTVGIWHFYFGLSKIGAPVPIQLEYKAKVLNATWREELPMIILLHGSGANENDLIQALTDYGFSQPARIISFRGPEREGFGFTWSYGRGASQKEAHDEYVKKVELVAKSIADSVPELTAKYSTVGKPFLMGFSKGAEIAYLLALRNLDRFSAIFPISGTLEDAPYFVGTTARAPASADPFIVAFHGTNDEVISFSSGKSTAEKLKSLGYHVEFVEHGDGHLFQSSVIRRVEQEMKTARRN